MTELKDRKTGLIGAGNMGAAIVEGLLAKKLVDPASVLIYDKDRDKADDFVATHGLRVAASSFDLVSRSDLVLLAVKPQDLFFVAEEMAPLFESGHVLISILAGMTLEKLREALGPEPSLVRAMPNLGARVGASLTALTSPCRKALSLAKAVFSGCGRTVVLDEKYFDLITALSGSGPAYFFLLMEFLAEKALARGLDAETAELIAVQTALGAARVAAQSGETAAVLRSQVTSKGGTTEAALNWLEKNGARDIFLKAFDQAEKRGRELRQSS